MSIAPFEIAGDHGLFRRNFIVSFRSGINCGICLFVEGRSLAFAFEISCVDGGTKQLRITDVIDEGCLCIWLFAFSVGMVITEMTGEGI